MEQGLEGSRPQQHELAVGQTDHVGAAGSPLQDGHLTAEIPRPQEGQHHLLALNIDAPNLGDALAEQEQALAIILLVQQRPTGHEAQDPMLVEQLTALFLPQIGEQRIAGQIEHEATAGWSRIRSHDPIVMRRSRTGCDFRHSQETLDRL